MKTQPIESFRRALAVAAFATLAMSCASTEMTSTWTDPYAKGKPLSRIAVICLTQDEGVRRMAEDQAAGQITGAHAVPSYHVLDRVDMTSREAVKAHLAAQGFDGALVMRLTGVSERVTQVGSPYGSFDGYYGYAGPAAYSSGYLQTETLVHVLSNLYSLDDNKLVWSGVSQTFNPASAKEVVVDVAKAVAKELEKEHLVL